MIRLFSVAATMLLAACWRGDERPARIALERTPCYGHCPSYRVVVDSDGRVVYSGDSHPDSARLSRAATDAVFAAFAAGWSRWRPNRFQIGLPTCLLPATDHPSVIIVREWRTRRDTAELYYGCPNAPVRIARMADAVDSAVGLLGWLGPQARGATP
jgi:hypothetical protein